MGFEGGRAYEKCLHIVSKSVTNWGKGIQSARGRSPVQKVQLHERLWLSLASFVFGKSGSNGSTK